MGVVPFITLIYLNVCILKKMMARNDWTRRSMHQTKHYRTSAIQNLVGVSKISRNVAINDVEQSEEIDTTSAKYQPRIHIQGNSNSGRSMVVLSWVNLAIVFVFMFCHSIKWIANFYEMMMVRYEKYTCVINFYGF